ncbi:MAG: hypothetical protein M3357_17275 [Actinomycetota bacterium]|nr:hypothetical protein [Actinomycetota bacterium]
MGSARVLCSLFGALLLAQGFAGGARGAEPMFTLNPTSGPPGSSYEAAASGPGNTCPTPNDVVIVAFVDAGGTETESDPIPVEPDGSWRATLAVPGTATPGAADLEAGCHASATADEPSLLYGRGTFTVTG